MNNLSRLLVWLILCPIALAVYLRRKGSAFVQYRVRCDGGELRVRERNGRWN